MKTKLIMNKFNELVKTELVKTNVINIGECRSSNFGRWLKSGGVFFRNGLKVGLVLKNWWSKIALGEKIGGRCADGLIRWRPLHFTGRLGCK